MSAKRTWGPDGMMTEDDTSKIDIHSCNKEAVFDMLITNIGDIKSDIREIKIELKETITAASTAASSLEKYKIEVKSFENGQNDSEERQKIAEELRKKTERDSWQRTIWIIMAVFALIGLGMNLYFNIKGNEKQDTAMQRVESLGIPFITNGRGEILALPDSTKIMYWPNDSLKYIIKLDK